MTLPQLQRLYGTEQGRNIIVNNK